MEFIKYVKPSKIFMGSIEHNSDLLEGITRICAEKNIHLGRVEAIGSVKKARLGFYNQQEQKYHYIDFSEPLEILSLIGNISLKDDKPFVHAHVALSDDKGNALGGHLSPGTIVFACEVIIYTFDGPEFRRGFNDETGLPLWEINE